MLESAGATESLPWIFMLIKFKDFLKNQWIIFSLPPYFYPIYNLLTFDNLTIASPDMGGSKRAYAYSKASSKVML